MINRLRDYITSIHGPCSSSELVDGIELRAIQDEVVFRGPLNLNVSVEVDNTFVPLERFRSNGERTVAASAYSYDVDIPVGYSWGFEMRQMLDSARLPHAGKVVIRCNPCIRPQGKHVPEIPCDFAVAHLPDCGYVFPSGCEPCGTAPVRMPPTCGPALTVVPAHGGCVRPLFFNGMFITREDMETELRYFRIKNNLQRRADGQGVVWGLGLGREGRSICVHPGYAVDCCGNDLVLTCTYKVEVAALLADPAIYNHHHHHHHHRHDHHQHHRHDGRECYSLLLEYVECPEEPRPVHGEPCGGVPNACEMSRVRETVRLRLVPKREHKPEGPIPGFLKELLKLKERDVGIASPVNRSSTISFHA